MAIPIFAKILSVFLLGYSLFKFQLLSRLSAFGDDDNAQLFQRRVVGNMELKHRVVFAPSTRYRATDDHVPLPHVEEYYSQRSSVKGSLLITEATAIAAKAGGYPNIPGIWSEDQIAAWKKITDAVHSNSSYIYLQLWALGRAADPEHLAKEDPSFPYVSASDIPINDGRPAPRPLTIPEIQEYISLFAQAAKNAVQAGFDGVEIHGANGYLINQFIDTSSNIRNDAYGGSIENRARFALEVTSAVVDAIGVEKTGIRFSPWGTYQDMGMKDPKPTYTYIISQLRTLHPNLSYIHLVEPRADPKYDPSTQSNDFIREIWKPKPLITCGGYERDTALEVAEEKGDIIAFSRYFISNPDLPYRLLRNISLIKGDRSKYYVYGSTDPAGYTDYPFAVPIDERV